MELKRRFKVLIGLKDQKIQIVIRILFICLVYFIYLLSFFYFAMIYNIKVNGDCDEKPQIQSTVIQIEEKQSNMIQIEEKQNYPSFANQIPGLSSALFSKSRAHQMIWWSVFIACICCGLVTTGLVITEFIKSPTATSITIKLMDTIEYPAITICPRFPDALNHHSLFEHIKSKLPNITDHMSHDLVSYWLAGSGLAYIKPAYSFNETYLTKLDEMYKIWSDGYDTKEFFHKIQNDYGYRCDQLFSHCNYDLKKRNCCEEMFQPVWVLRHGLCYQTRRNINQTQDYGVGWFYVELKPPPSITEHTYSGQSALILFLTDNYQYTAPSPRYYLLPDNDNRLMLNARLIELKEHAHDCTNNIVGKDVACFLNMWMTSHFLNDFNCTLPYIEIPGISNETKICDPLTIAKDYENLIVDDTPLSDEQCIPGCKKWEYSRSFIARDFKQKVGPDYKFTLAIGFDNLQYEHVQEFSTISISGLISQVGGQLGLYLGLSIITLFQIFIFSVKKIFGFLRYLLPASQN